MTDFEKRLLKLFLTEPVSFITAIKNSDDEAREFYDKLSDLITEIEPDVIYCKSCFSENVEWRVAGHPEDDGYVCMDCGSTEICDQ